MAKNYTGSDDSIRTFLSAVDMNMRRQAEAEERIIRLKEAESALAKEAAKAEVDVIGAEIEKIRAQFEGRATIMDLGIKQQGLEIERTKANAALIDAEASKAMVETRDLSSVIEDADRLMTGAGDRVRAIDAELRKIEDDADRLASADYVRIFGPDVVSVSEDGVPSFVAGGDKAPNGIGAAYKTTGRLLGYVDPMAFMKSIDGRASGVMAEFGAFRDGRIVNPSSSGSATSVQLAFAYGMLEENLAAMQGSGNSAASEAAKQVRIAMKQAQKDSLDAKKAANRSEVLTPDDLAAVLQVGIEKINEFADDSGSYMSWNNKERRVDFYDKKNQRMIARKDHNKEFTVNDLVLGAMGDFGELINGANGALYRNRAMIAADRARLTDLMGEAQSVYKRRSKMSEALERHAGENPELLLARVKVNTKDFDPGSIFSGEDEEDAGQSYADQLADEIAVLSGSLSGNMPPVPTDSGAGTQGASGGSGGEAASDFTILSNYGVSDGVLGNFYDYATSEASVWENRYKNHEYGDRLNTMKRFATAPKTPREEVALVQDVVSGIASELGATNESLKDLFGEKSAIGLFKDSWQQYLVDNGKQDAKVTADLVMWSIAGAAQYFREAVIEALDSREERRRNARERTKKFSDHLNREYR